MYSFLKNISYNPFLDASSGSSKRSQSKMKLNSLMDAIKMVFSLSGSSKKDGQSAQPSTQSRDWSSYRCHLTTNSSSGPSSSTSSSCAGSRKLSLWCFHSGVAMRELADQGVWSIVLASGTLSPLSSFAIEMGIPFPIQLSNPHIISDSNLMVGIVSTGPTQVAFNSSYNARENNMERYSREVGLSLVNFVKKSPDGMLVFFPSYGLMDECIAKWKQRPQSDVREKKRVFVCKIDQRSISPRLFLSHISTFNHIIKALSRSIWERITEHKEILVEPKSKTEFDRAIQEYYRKINDTRTAISAIFFAVCRGKASEGIDFSDNKGRTVVIIGIPFPAAKDPKVVLKKQILDTSSSAAGYRTYSSATSLSGNQWYNQQASRAV